MLSTADIYREKIILASKPYGVTVLAPHSTNFCYKCHSNLSAYHKIGEVFTRYFLYYRTSNFVNCFSQSIKDRFYCSKHCKSLNKDFDLLSNPLLQFFMNAYHVCLKEQW